MILYTYNIWDEKTGEIKETLSHEDEKHIHNLIRLYKKYDFVKPQLEAGEIRIEYVGAIEK
jgi:hypothetical protein